MERFDIDDIIRNKVNQESGVESRESREAKPFIWASVYNNLNTRKGLRWYHLAAAMILLAISFVFFEIRTQEKHQREIASLASQIQLLQSTYEGQENVIRSKEAEVQLLKSNLKTVENQLESMEMSSDTVVKERLLVRRDTVYIKQVEYIQLATLESASNLPDTNIEDSLERDVSTANLLEKEKARATDVEIFPSMARTQTNQTGEEAVKIRFGSFLTSKN